MKFVPHEPAPADLERVRTDDAYAAGLYRRVALPNYRMQDWAPRSDPICARRLRRLLDLAGERLPASTERTLIADWRDVLAAEGLDVR